MFGIAVIGKACSLFFFFCSWWFYVPPTEAKVPPSESKPEVNSKRDLCNGVNGGPVAIHYEDL